MYSLYIAVHILQSPVPSKQMTGSSINLIRNSAHLPHEILSLFSSRFLEVERPGLSKASRTLAFAYPYLFDSIPLFYRVCTAPRHPLAAGLETSAASA